MIDEVLLAQLGEEGLPLQFTFYPHAKDGQPPWRLDWSSETFVVSTTGKEPNEAIKSFIEELEFRRFKTQVEAISNSGYAPTKEKYINEIRKVIDNAR